MKNNLLCPVRKCDGLQLASLSEIYFNSFPEEERRPLDDILCRAAVGDKGLNLMLLYMLQTEMYRACLRIGISGT